MRDAWMRLRALLRHRAVEQELDEELRFHYEQQVEKVAASGMTLEEARRRARLMIGGTEQIKEECRDARGVHFLESLAQDVRYGLRSLRKSRGFTGVAIVTLMLGIGVNTALFTIINGVLLNPLPFPRPDRLVSLWERQVIKARTRPRPSVRLEFQQLLPIRTTPFVPSAVLGEHRNSLLGWSRG